MSQQGKARTHHEQGTAEDNWGSSYRDLWETKSSEVDPPMEAGKLDGLSFSSNVSLAEGCPPRPGWWQGAGRGAGGAALPTCRWREEPLGTGESHKCFQ